MAARRLIMVLLVMLFISSLVAALVPMERSSRSDEDTSTVTEATEQPSDAEARLLVRRIASSAAKQTIRMRLGEQLQLTVAANRPDQVEIPALDLIEPVDLGSPAYFDLLPDQARSYAVRLVEANQRVAKIDVTAPGREKAANKR
jgi:hypothetical protein